MNPEITAWAQRHAVSPEAMQELTAIMGIVAEPESAEPSTPEAAVQVLSRTAFTRGGGRLWRNNVGVLKNPAGIYVRFGLANESSKINAIIKSSDLIGIEPVTIAAHHVGQTLGRFVAFEIKRPEWKYAATDRERAQLAFINLINSLGGRARFVTDPSQVS